MKTLEEFITERTRIISEMLDNPSQNEIYPTAKCFEQLDLLFKEYTLPWIKVADRLPEIGQMILVYVPSIDMICRDQYRHFEGINKNSFVYKGVSHWMPLPEPPEV